MTKTWQIDGPIATLEHGALSATVKLASPSEGIGQVRLAGDALACQLACVSIADVSRKDAISTETPLSIEEAYVRGDDLIVVYSPSPELPYRWQVYWRYVEAEGPQLATIDAILSVQTPRLDTRPFFVVGSRTPATRATFLDPEGRSVPADNGCLGVQAGAAGLAAVMPLACGRTLIEMVHPEDYDGCQVVVSDDGGVKTTWRLGETFMEKGVIRRIVFGTTLLPTDVAEAVAPSLLRPWLIKAPPLTA